MAAGTFHFQPRFLQPGRFHPGRFGLSHSPAALRKGELRGRRRRRRRRRRRCRDQGTDHHHLVIAVRLRDLRGLRGLRDRLHWGRWSWSCWSFTGLHITDIAAGQIELLLVAGQPWVTHMTQVAQNVKSKKKGWYRIDDGANLCKFCMKKTQCISKCVSFQRKYPADSAQYRLEHVTWPVEITSDMLQLQLERKPTLLLHAFFEGLVFSASKYQQQGWVPIPVLSHAVFSTPNGDCLWHDSALSMSMFEVQSPSSIHQHSMAIIVRYCEKKLVLMLIRSVHVHMLGFS